MSSSSADCVASQSTPRPISGSENTCNDGALISLMQQQQPSSFSAPTMPVPISAPAGVLSADDLPLPSVITADKTNVNGKGGDAAFLCLAKRHAAVEDVDASPTAGGTLAPLSQLSSPATPPESAVTRSPPLPASRRSSLSPTSLVCDVAQRLRTAVQQQRHHPLPDSAAVGAVGLHAAPQTARPTSADDGDDGDSGGPFSDSGDTAKVTQAPAPINSADACLNAPTLTSFPPLPSSAARTASSHRQTSPAVAAMLNVDSHHLKETFNMSSLAQLAFNRSVASITTRPPATASNELVKEKRSGAMYINNYRILKSLGHGSCGKVKLAYDEVESRLVAIKSVRRVDPRKRLGGLTTAQKQYNAFMREVEVMKRLRHRNIVSLYEVIDDPSADKLYLVMQYVDKGVVAKVEVRANSDYVCDPVPPPQLAYYAREMLTGLQYLHRHDVVHRDLKPDNILVSKDGHAYLADFGVAETFDTSYLQRRESIMQQSMAMSMAMSVAGGRAGGPQVLGTKGTPLFIAPELWDGAKSYGKPVDMWAMGVTLFTLLVGKLPFRSPEDITDATYTPTVPEEFGEQWRVLLGGLLNRDSSARWTVEKARGYVQFCLDSGDVPLPPEGTNANSPATLSTPKPTTSLTSFFSNQLPVHPGAVTNSATQRASDHDVSIDTIGSPHVTRGGEGTQISFSGTGSHAFNVDFLPMPDNGEEVLTPGPMGASPPDSRPLCFMPEVIAIGLSRAQAAAEAGGGQHSDEKEKEETESQAALMSVFTSPFDTSAAMARAISSTLLMSQSCNALAAQLVSPLTSTHSTTFALPPNLALQRLPTAQLSEASGPRGRRTQQQQQQRRRGNCSASRSAHHSKSHEAQARLSFSSPHPNHNNGSRFFSNNNNSCNLSAAAVAFNGQERELRRMASPPQVPSSMFGTSSTVVSAALPPPESPTVALSQSLVTLSRRNTEEEAAVPLPTRREHAPRLGNRLLSPLRVLAAGNQQQLVSSAGIVLPYSHANGAIAMDNAIPARVGKPRVRYHEPH
ncbi:protein kinase [Lotmaria passim]